MKLSHPTQKHDTSFKFNPSPVPLTSVSKFSIHRSHRQQINSYVFYGFCCYYKWGSFLPLYLLYLFIRKLLFSINYIYNPLSSVIILLFAEFWGSRGFLSCIIIKLYSEDFNFSFSIYLFRILLFCLIMLAHTASMVLNNRVDSGHFVLSFRRNVYIVSP